MASSFSFHLALALLLVLVHQQAGKPYNFDLYKAVETFVKRMGKMCNREIVWWDVHGKQDEVQGNRRRYPPPKPLLQGRVTATAGAVVYGTTKSPTKRTNVIHTEWVNNGLASSSLNHTFESKTKHKKTATWHVEAGFSYSGSVTANARILIVNIKDKQRISLDLKGGHREEVSNTETFPMDVVVPVPPMKAVKIEWTITDTVTEVPWTSTVTATGHIAIKYKKKLEGRFLWHYNLFSLQDSRLKDAGNNTFLYTAKGTFTAVKELESDFRVTEYDYQEGLRQSGHTSFL